MKKLFFLIGVAALVTLFAGQAIAGEWSWYGSVRMMAWRFNDEPAMGAGEDDEYTQFFMENPVSRVGAKIKAANKKVTARLEFGFYDEKDVLATGSSAAAGAKNDVEDNKAYLRLLYATWDFGGGKLSIGQMYSAMSLGTSSQAGPAYATRYGNAFSYWGTFHDSRQAQVKLDIGGFSASMIHPHKIHDLGDGAGKVRYDIPKIVAGYKFKLDPLSFRIAGAYMTWDVEERGAGIPDVSADAYGAGVEAGLRMGPLYLEGTFTMAQNGYAIGDLNVTNLGNKASLTNPVTGIAGNNVIDVESYAFNLNALYKLNDMFELGAGYGFCESEYDVPGSFPDDEALYYGQVVITLAPGVFVVPEIGKRDYKDKNGKDQGSRTYFGAKMQIDF